MKLAIGTVQFGLDYGIANQNGQINQNEANLILNYAKTHHIETLDTAISYGNSEQRLGEIGITDWQVVTKLPAVPDGCLAIDKWIHTEVQASLARLRINALYGLLLHRPEQLLLKQGRDIYKALQTVKARGWVKKIGISIYDPTQLQLLTENYQLDIIQAPYNLFDRRLITSGWMDRLTDMNIELHTRSLFLQGLLLMTSDERPAKFNRWQSVWQTWEQWIADTNLKPLQACISDAIAQTNISRVIVGVDNLEQLKEILLATKTPPIESPQFITCNDTNLINPTLWNTL